MVITSHALDRYIERIARVDRAAAYAAIAASECAIEAAGAFGAHAVKTGEAKLILQFHDVRVIGGGMHREVHVVTVIPRRQIDHGDLSNRERAQRFADHRARCQ